MLIMERRKHRLRLRVAFKLPQKERRDLTRLKPCSKRMRPLFQLQTLLVLKSRSRNNSSKIQENVLITKERSKRHRGSRELAAQA